MKRGRSSFSLLIVGFLVLLYGPHVVLAAEVSFPEQVQAGNIFTVGEKVSLKAVITSGSEVRWTISDFDDKPVASGTVPVKDHEVLLDPKVVGTGYYILHLVSMRGTVPAGEGRTTLAIVPRFDIARMADSRYGVMTHFATGMPLDDRLLPILEKGGVSWIRDEQPWDALEKTKGQYDFTPRFTAYMEAARKRNMSVLFDASFGNTLYDTQPNVKVYKLAPHTREGYTAFADYCVAVLQRYGPQLHCIEIWNEYNGTFCDGIAAQDRPRYYTELLKTAYTKIKTIRPDVTVLGGATVKVPIPYLEKLFKLGALDSLDAIAVHPYQTPETVERSLADLIVLTKRYNHGKSKPIWATECGFAHDPTSDRPDAASHLVRMMVLESTFPEVQRIIWYLSRDFREFTNMGLVRADNDPAGAFTPTMPYAAYANLIHLLNGASFVRRESSDDRTLVYRFDTPARTVWACWSEVGTAEMTFAGRIRRLSVVGSELPASSVDGLSTACFGTTPIYVVADKGAVADVKEMPRNDQLIADSLRDFSDVQGKNGWSYHFVGNDRTGSAPYDPAKVSPMRWLPSPGDWADVWTGPGKYFTLSEQGGSGGGIDGGQGWAVLRWTSDREGPVHIMATPRAPTQGDGIGVKVFADGKELFSQLLSIKTTAAIDLAPTISKGTRLDFVVTPGPGTDVDYDSVNWRISILTQATH